MQAVSRRRLAVSARSTAAIICAALGSTLFAGAAAAEETTRIDQASLIERIERKDPALLVLDVRTPEEYAAGHVPGAVNVPYTHLPARIAELKAVDKDVVIYCRSGVRAERAASRLRENGFTRLLHLDGDIAKWEENKRPISK